MRQSCIETALQRIASVLAVACVGLTSATAQMSFTLGDGPWEFQTQRPILNIRVSVIAQGIDHPWGMVFLPGNDILIAERDGDLRIIRDGVLDPRTITGVPEVAEASSGGLMDLALHPDYATNGWIYFAYVKGAPPPEDADYYATTALGRGRLDGNRLVDVEDVFVANAWGTAPGGHGSRIRFAPDGTLFFSQPFRREDIRAQNTMDHVGSLLRINDDGSVPADNPFVGQDGFLPEIYSYGHRAIEGLTYHPASGELFATEHGPQGGDEFNRIQAGGNYGWPLVSYGRNYDGTRVSDRSWREDLIDPELFWVPSIATSGMMFYTGEAFPQWQGNLFVGSLMTARIPGTGHVQRILFNENGEQGRESLLTELKQRVRDVQQGPDGLIYVLTEEENGALLVIEPAE